MNLKQAIIKSVIFSKELLKDFNSGYVKATEKYNDFITEHNKEILWKQRKLTLDFFVSNHSNYYDNLSSYLLPYNIGFHFNNGTVELKKYCNKIENGEILTGDSDVKKKNNETILNLYNHIKKDIITMNFYMEQEGLQYKRIYEIKKIVHKYGSSEPYCLHEHFLFCIENYYTKIFPAICEIEKIIAINGKNMEIISEFEEDRQKIFVYFQAIQEAFEEISNFNINSNDHWLKVFN